MVNPQTGYSRVGCTYFDELSNWMKRKNKIYIYKEVRLNVKLLWLGF
jgi:hypothetical protein